MNHKYEGDCSDGPSRETVRSLRRDLEETKPIGKKIPRLAMALEDNDVAIEKVHSRVARLIDKLKPILEPANPAKEDCGVESEPQSTSEITRLINIKTSRLHAIANMIDDAEDRLEV